MVTSMRDGIYDASAWVATIGFLMVLWSIGKVAYQSRVDDNDYRFMFKMIGIGLLLIVIHVVSEVG